MRKGNFIVIEIFRYFIVNLLFQYGFDDFDYNSQLVIPTNLKQ